MQVTLKENFLGTDSGNPTELEKLINEQTSKGFNGGDRIQATIVFEKI